MPDTERRALHDEIEWQRARFKEAEAEGGRLRALMRQAANELRMPAADTDPIANALKILTVPDTERER
jgi:hypothetical protein